MRFLILGLVCLGAVIPSGFGAGEKVEVAQGQDAEKADGFQKLRGDLEKLFAERQYVEAVARCDVYLAQEGLNSEQKQAGLSLKYFALMRAREFAKASKTAKLLHDEAPTTTLGKQAIGLQQQADAALVAAADQPKPVKPVEVKKGNAVAKTDKEGPEERPKVASEDKPQKVMPKKHSAHEKSLQALDASHQALAKAELAFEKAKADLAAAQAAHLEAHKAETVARELAEKKSARGQGKKEEPQNSEDVQKDEAAPQIEAFEKRAADLGKRAAELREKAEELRKAAQE